MSFRSFAACLFASTAVVVSASGAVVRPVAKVAVAPVSEDAMATGQSTGNALSLAEQDALVAKAQAVLDNLGDDNAGVDDARAMLDRVLAANPANSPAHIQMARYEMLAGNQGQGQFVSGSLDRAEAQLRKAHTADRNNTDALVLLGNLREEQYRPEEALKALLKAQSMGSTSPWLYINLEGAYAELGQWDKADESLSAVEALHAQHDDFSSHIKAGMVSARMQIDAHHGDDAAVDRDYRRLLELKPDSAWRHGDYAAFLLGARQDPDAAIEEAGRALKLMDYPMAHFALGLAQYVKWNQLRLSDPAKARAFRIEAERNIDQPRVLTFSAPWIGASPLLQNLVLALKAEGLSLDARDDEGSTAANCAVSCDGRGEPLRWLLDHGASVDGSDENGMTPLIWAANARKPKAADLLLARGANLESHGGRWRWTALYCAAQNDDSGMARKLLAAKADPNDTIADGYTPLMRAAAIGSREMVELLLDAGADPSMRTTEGKSAAGEAEADGNPAIAALIHARMDTKKESR